MIWLICGSFGPMANGPRYGTKTSPGFNHTLQLQGGENVVDRADLRCEALP